jgi:cobalt-zinc-cadmium efflux system membrane fusion protein
VVEFSEQPLAVAAPPAPAAPKRSRLAAAARRVLRSIPQLVVFSVLGGLLVWGHRTDWALPKFSALLGEPGRPPDDWCDEHSVPESVCVECNPELMPRPKAYGWCREHGVHECPLEHPDVAQVAERPVVSAADFERASRALALLPRPENNSRCRLHERRIQFVSAEAAEKAGVEIDQVWTAPMVEVVAVNCEVIYDPTRTARLSTKAPGTVFKAFKQIGNSVATGEVVALIDAAEVGRAKTDLFQSLVQIRLKERVVRNLREVAEPSAVSPRTLNEAEAALADARIRFAAARQALTNLGLPVDPRTFEKVRDEELPERLRLLGLPKAVADSIDPGATSGNLLPVVAPHDGVVATRDVVAGEVVDASKVLFLVVDPRALWLTLAVGESDARLVKPGQAVRFRPAGGPAEVRAVVSWVSPEVDHRTRTVRARARLDPATTGELKANTYGPGRVILREESNAVVVPNAALQWDGDCHVVFVRDKNYLEPDAPKVFHTRTVRPGARDERHTEIIAGLLSGEVVAVKGSAALRAELLKGRLGEG